MSFAFGLNAVGGGAVAFGGPLTRGPDGISRFIVGPFGGAGAVGTTGDCCCGDVVAADDG